MSTHVYVINTHTGEHTPYQTIWHEDWDACVRCGDACETLDDEGYCDTCNELRAMDDWLNRPAEAQDRAVLRGMG